MDMRVVTGIILLGLIVLVGISLWGYQRRRTARLRSRFGSEYERTVQDRAGRARAEAELEARVQRVKTLHIHDLESKERARLAQAWQSVQTQFADDPQGAVAAADRLVGEAMQARGYPVGSSEQCVADLSVYHAHVVGDYRRAREISSGTPSGQASTENLREAMICYRALFADLVGTDTGKREVRNDWAA